MFKMIHCVGPLVFHGGKIPNSHLATRFPTRSSTVCMWSVWMVLLASLMSMSLGSLGWHVEAGWKCPGAMEILICRFCRFPCSKWLYRFRSAESTIYVYKCMYIWCSVGQPPSPPHQWVWVDSIVWFFWSPPPVACGGGMVLLVPPPLWPVVVVWFFWSPPLWPVVVVCWYVGMLVCRYVGM